MRIVSQVLGGAFGLGALSLLASCSTPKPVATPPAPSVALEVRNHSSFQLDVYSVPLLGADHVRLGSVPAFGSSDLTLNRGERQPDGSLLLEVHAIGSSMTWLSPDVVATRDDLACLDVYSDLSGDLSRSVLSPSCNG